MAVNLSIKEVPEAMAERLRARAERNHRSLQGELMAIIEQAAAEPAPGPTQAVLPPRAAVTSPDGGVEQGWKSIEQLLAERRARGWKPDPRMAGLPLGVDIVRADRDSR